MADFIDYLELEDLFEIEEEEEEGSLFSAGGNSAVSLIHECGHAAAFIHIVKESGYQTQFSEIRVNLYPNGVGLFSYFLEEGRLDPMTLEEKVLVAVAGPVWEYMAELGIGDLEDFCVADFAFAMYSEIQYSSDLLDIQMVSAEKELELIYSSAQLAAELYCEKYDTVLGTVASQLMPYMGGELAVFSIKECLSW